MTDELVAFVETTFTGEVRLEQWQRHVLTAAFAGLPIDVGYRHGLRSRERARVDEWARFALTYLLPAIEAKRRARLRRMHTLYSRRRS